MSLIKRLKHKDEQAFREIVEMYKERVFHTCWGFMKSMSDAEDVTQDVFIEVYHSIKKFRDESSLYTWIYRVAVNKCLERIRKRQRREKILGLMRLATPKPSQIEHPQLLLEDKERAEYISNALETLPDSQRVAFTLYVIEGLSQKEIAKIMEKSTDAVESLIRRAKKTLQGRLKSYVYQST